MSERPVVRIHLTEKRTLRMRLPVKHARWHGAYKNIDEAVRAALTAGVVPPLLIDYVTQED